jgi:hypothetical protein
MTKKYLYRGVNKEMHDKAIGLNSKGTTLNRVVQLGEEFAQLGSGMQLGHSNTNGILAHQTDSSRYPTSGISTTTEFEIAKKYATYSNKVGYVYKFDVDDLIKLGIEMFKVSDYIPYPKKPCDNEVILKHKLNKSLPSSIIKEVILVEKSC